MYKEKELESIKNQKLYDMNHYINEDLTIWDWKQRFLDKLFVVDTYSMKKVIVTDGLMSYQAMRKVKDNRISEKDQSAIVIQEIQVDPNNFGLAKGVRKQIIKFRDVFNEDLESVCNEIITKSVAKFKIQDDCIRGQEENMLASYILKCLDLETQSYVNKNVGAIRVRTDEEESVYVPDLFLSFETKIGKEDENGNKKTVGQIVSNKDSITYQHMNYEQSDTLKMILDVIEGDLSEEQKLLLHLLSITNNNNAQAGVLLKKYDTRQGNELRASDEAYRVFVSREKAKIVEIVENEINISNISNIGKLKYKRDRIKNFLNKDLVEKDVIDFTLSHLNEKYIEHIVYDLDLELRQHFILNFKHNYNDNLLEHEKTRKACTYILEGLYNYIEQFSDNFDIEKNIEKKKNINKVSETAERLEQYYKYTSKDKYTYDLYIIKDKIKEYQRKDIQGESVISVEITRLDMDYDKYDLDCYYLGKRKYNKNSNRKTRYGKMNLAGKRYFV